MPDYTETESQYRDFLLRRIEDSRNARETPHDEFNGLGYTQWYEANSKAVNSYTPPRKNPEDTQIVTGTTREKALSIVSAALNLNFETFFRAFDQNNIEKRELGEAMTDCVFQSGKVEQWDDKKLYVYFELVSQGDAFVEDVELDEVKVDKRKIPLSELDSKVFKSFSPEKSMRTVYSGCRRTLLPGPQVFLGNIREWDIRKQPFIFTREIIPYELAKSRYGTLPRFKNVPRNLVEIESADNHWGYNWRLESLQKDMVEVIKYQDKWNDEFQILLNGVMQLPVGFPMPWEHGEYSIVKGSLEPISPFFAYSKSIPSKTKLDQEILDEMYRLAVLKSQKSFMPPIANYSGNILSKSMFLPGKINNELVKGEIEVLGGNPDAYSLKPSEFQMIEMIKKFVDEKSVSQLYQGMPQQGEQTATEVTTIIQQAKQKLGLIIFGFMQFHANLDMLRLHNLLDSYTKPTGTRLDEVKNKIVDRYRTVNVERAIDDRGVGMKTIEFTEDFEDGQTLYDREEGVTRDESGTPVSVNPPDAPKKIIQVSPKALREIRFSWYPEVMPVEKESSLAERISFEDRIMKAMQMFGVQSVNQEYAKQMWASKNKVNPNYFFSKNPQPAQPQEEVDKMQEGNVTKINRSSPTGEQESMRQGYGQG